MKIGILDDYHGVARRYADWETLGPGVEVDVFNSYLPEGSVRDAALAPYDVLVIMRERTQFPASQLHALPNLKLLVTTGLRNLGVDMQACREAGITVCGAKGSDDGNLATAELAWAHILALFKNLPQEFSSMREGHWQTGMPIPLAGKRLGIVGLGRLGAATARVGLAFGMDVVAWSANLTSSRADEVGVQMVDKATLFATSDVVSLHLILSERTRHIVDRATLDTMKPSAFLVNTSRAGLVEQEALMTILADGKLGGAGLDVFDEEPLAADHPVRQMPNVTLTPHLGYVSESNFQSFYGNALRAVQAWRDGAPIEVLASPTPH